MSDRKQDYFDGGETCVYCGYNQADQECEMCREKYCGECLDENKLCPFCSGRDMKQPTRK